jgi:hypothetical protein
MKLIQALQIAVNLTVQAVQTMALTQVALLIVLAIQHVVPVLNVMQIR